MNYERKKKQWIQKICFSKVKLLLKLDKAMYKVKKIFILLVSLIGTVAYSAENLLSLKADGSDQERIYLFDDHSIVDRTIPRTGPFRVVDLQKSVTYRFELDNAAVEKIRLRLGNSYRILLSTDGKNYKEFLSSGKTIRGLANLDQYEIDCREFLKEAKAFYLKMVNFDPKRGFGGCLFSVELWGTGSMVSLKPKLNAVRTNSLIMDGKIEDQEWENAQWNDNFTLLTSGGIPTQPSRVSMMYDDKNLYIGFKCYDSKIEQLTTSCKKRDEDVFRDCSVEFFIKPAANQYFHFGLNPAGVLFDEKIVIGCEPDRAWNSNAMVKTSTRGDRWEAELAIPWKDLEYNPADRSFTLSVNFTRNAGIHGEISTFVPLYMKFHQPDKFAPVILSENCTLPSFAANISLLSKNPPSFSYTRQSANDNTSSTAGVRVRYYPVDRKFSLQANKAVLERSIVLEPGKSNLLANAPLPTGTYIILIDYLVRGNNQYSNAVVVNMRDENCNALAAELLTPVIQGRDVALLEYQNNTPGPQNLLIYTEDVRGKVMSEQKITAAPGSGLCQIPTDALPPGEYTIKIVLANKSQSLTENTFHLEKIEQSSFPARVKIKENLTIWVNDKLFIPFAICWPTDFKEIADKGFNMAIVGKENVSPVVMEKNQKQLDAAYANGILAAFHLCNTMRHKEDYETLKKIVCRFKNHPALGFWYISDEPSGTSTLGSTLKRAADIIRLIDPNHPIMGCDNNPFNFGIYGQRAIHDVFMPDPYPIPYSNINMVADWILRSVAASDGKTAIVPFLQAQGKPWYPRSPDETELFNMTIQALACGSKGVAYWAHGPARASKEWACYSRLGEMVKTVSAYTVELNPKIDYDKKTLISTFTGKDYTVRILVNLEQKQMSLETPADDKQVLVASNDIRFKNQTVTLPPYGYIVFLSMQNKNAPEDLSRQRSNMDQSAVSKEN